MTADAPFDLDSFLARPLVARVATNGPTVRPVWFLWEDGAFWWLSHARNRLARRLAVDPRVALVVDTCDLDTGRVLRVIAYGSAELLALDRERAWRKLSKYLGSDHTRWDPRFEASTFGDPGTRMVRLRPDSLRARDLSYRTLGSGRAQQPTADSPPST